MSFDYIGVEDSKYIDEIRRAITMETPFVKEELTDDILDYSIGKAFSLLNRHKPNFIRIHGTISEPGYTLIRSYASRYDFGYTNSFVDIHDHDFTDMNVYAKNWTMNDIWNHKNPDVKSKFKDAVVYRAAMHMANNRRSVGMNDLPFDTKGDQLYEQFKDSYDSLKEDLINSTDNTQ